MSKRLPAACALVTCLLFATQAAHLDAHMAAAVLPPGFAIAAITGGLTEPTAMALAPDGRLFVAERGGAIRVLADDTLSPDPFATVVTDYMPMPIERGLLGLALDPAFASNGYAYVYYTVEATETTGQHNRLSRLSSDGTVATGETILLDLPDVGPKHVGGAIHFGSDGKLYLTVGDNATPANAQALDNPFGKLLRVNPDGTIPGDNPFYTSATGLNRAIWAYGLRNPFTFDVEPGSGQMLINDVGENTYEEINRGVKGANYGWPVCEGPCQPPDPTYTEPLYTYIHGGGADQGCAITGGVFYDPPAPGFPSEYSGQYLFGDLCNGWIAQLSPAGGTVTPFASGFGGIVDMDVGPAGDLLVLSYDQGEVARIRYTAPSPTPTSSPTATPSSTATAMIPSATPSSTATPVVPSPTPSVTAISVVLSPTPSLTPASPGPASPTPTLTPTLECSERPATPELLAPPPHARVHTRRPLFDWVNSPCANTYKFVLRRDSPQGAIVVRAKHLRQAEYMSPLLERTTTYYWQVRACHASECTASEWRRVRILSK